jgi:recombinational DNA repair protein (RecF pathway)
MSSPSDARPPCAVCGGPVEPFGHWKQTFFHPDLGDLICTDCAKKLAPDSYAMAESNEAATGPFDPDKGL